MIEAIAEIIEAAQEVAISIEECQIPISVIEDLQSFFEELSESESEIESLADSESFDNGISNMSGQQLEARSTFIKDGHSYETDDRGNPFKKDGELIPETEFTSNGGKYYVDSNGNVEVLEEGYQSSYKERLAQTPVGGDRGTWEGIRGESCYRPNQETERDSKAI